VLTQVCQVIGAPKPVNFKRKFLIKNVDDIHLQIPVKAEQFEVEQTYLVHTKGEPKGFTFIRRRGQNGSYHYSYSSVRDAPDSDEKIVVERQMSGREYIALTKVQLLCLHVLTIASNLIHLV
jgi:hypothetical protein